MTQPAAESFQSLVEVNQAIVVESNSLTSDMNPYFPVPECECGGPFQALWAGDYESIFVLSDPFNIPRHNLYELTWIVLKGWPRLQRILRGEVELEFDPDILFEGYRYETRTEQIGGHGVRDTTKIDLELMESIA